MATGTIAPTPKFTGLDANGNPVAGGLLYTFTAGTSTPINTYTDVGLTVANANPIVLDSSGRATIYLTPGSSYKFNLQTSVGATVWTQDNIAATPVSAASVDVVGTAGEAITAGNAVYLSDGSGSKVAGQWYKADAANGYSSTLPTIGMAPSAITSGAAGSIRLFGSVSGLSSLSVSAKYYVGTSGAITSSPATGGRFIGVADSATSINLTPQAPVPQPWTVIATTSTGTQNDFAPGLVGNTVIRCNNATLLTITGLAGGYDGQRVILVSIGAGQVDTAHGTSAAGLNSVAANRFLNIATSGNTSGAPGVGSFEYVYDATTARWRLVLHEQGAWITPTYASGNYTAATGTWTVDSGDVTTQAYWLKGRTLTVAFNLVTTSVSATPVTLNIGNGAWGSFTSAKAVIGTHINADNAAAFAVGYVAAGAGSSILTVNKITGSWATATNTTAANGQITFEVQ